ncbi:RNA ligase [Candidatus Micrarchaeota archaeon]|nr:RNA ligase [Candidatus Micrarchaeota archaeon]
MELTKALALEAKKKGKLAFHDEYGIKFARFIADFRSIERGTIIIGNRVIYAYPHIKRIFTLERGIARNIKSETVYIEEKIDGYNTRVASVNGKIVAFSRGGFIDYFITEKVSESTSIRKFFSKFPQAIFCAEAIGNTPYTKPTKDFDIKIFVFDIATNNGYVPCSERYELLRKFGIEDVPAIGKFQRINIKDINKIALAILKAKKEGIVIKSDDRKEAIKYVTPYADISDIANNTRLLFDMPLGFYMQRVLRSAMFIKDFDLDHEHYAKQLGEAFYNKLIDALQKLEKGEEISEEFEITIKDTNTWDMLLRQMSREVKIEKLFEKEENGKLRIRFKKIYRRTNKRLRELLNGKGVED